jgi:hypothetical protein
MPLSVLSGLFGNEVISPPTISVMANSAIMSVSYATKSISGDIITFTSEKFLSYDDEDDMNLDRFDADVADCSVHDIDGTTVFLSRHW